ncbi:MAG: dihydrofolate reductase [Candidatus Lightella neohaematopini]|nr:dihydrofolate reductase [Candidatus Lightella neohaematopini]
MIVAVAKNRVIGLNNNIPWNIPIDRLWFKKHTLHKTIIMGRNTYESIGILPYRYNIILTKTIKNTNFTNVKIVNTIKEILLSLNDNDEHLIIGGAQIYKLFFKYTKRLYITNIDLLVHGNVFFPKFDLRNWYPVFIKYYRYNKVNLCFKILEKR